jgi:hypothetical protein
MTNDNTEEPDLRINNKKPPASKPLEERKEQLSPIAQPTSSVRYVKKGTIQPSDIEVPHF